MQETKDYDEFKVGDKVYCAIRGEGIVVNTYLDDNIKTVVVEFLVQGRRVHQGYTQDGRMYSGLERTLFFTPPELKPGSVKRPYESKLIGKEVVVALRDSTFWGTVSYEDDTCIKIYTQEFWVEQLVIKKSSITRIREIGKDIIFQ